MGTNYLMLAADEADRRRTAGRDVLKVGSRPADTLPTIIDAAMAVLQKHDLISEFAIEFNKRMSNQSGSH